MRGIFARFFILSLSWTFFCTIPCNGTELSDSTHRKLVLPDHPQRIVCLAPSLSELAADLLGKDLDRIIGVSEYSDYPPKMKTVPTVGPYNQFSIEKVLSLKPDLVLATSDGNSKDQIVHLRELGVSVLTVSTSNFAEIQESVRTIGLALGVPDIGNQMSEQLQKGIERIREKGKTKQKLRVMLQIGGNPLVVVGQKSFLNEALISVGALNSYSDAQTHYPKPSLEDAIQRDPDVIVVLALGEDLKPFRVMANEWGKYEKMKAVKNRKVIVLKSDALLRPTIRFLEGLSLLQEVIYAKK